MFEDIISKWAYLYDVPEFWIRAWIQTESSGDPNAYRSEPQISDASYGLMQVLTQTARGLGYNGPPEGLYDPDTNVGLGTQLIAQLRARFPELANDPAAIYSAYNAGSPTAYLSPGRAADNVRRFLVNLDAAAPAVAGAALLAAGLIGFWLWKQRRK